MDILGLAIVLGAFMAVLTLCIRADYRERALDVRRAEAEASSARAHGCDQCERAMLICARRYPALAGLAALPEEDPEADEAVARDLASRPRRTEPL